MNCMLHATAGWIADHGSYAEPGPLNAAERQLLGELAREVAGLAAQPEQKEKREQWFRHNRLEKTRPLMLMFPEGAWHEVLPASALVTVDPFWRQVEWYLRQLIHRHRHFQDDFVIEPVFWVNKVTQQTGWGVEARFHHAAQADGSYVWEAPVKEESDLDRLTYPTITVDEEATRRRMDRLREVLSPWLEVRPHGGILHASTADTAAYLRGIEPILWDISDRPDWLHRLMDFVSEGLYRMARALEAGGYFTLNNNGHYNDSGGIGYSSELPSPDHRGLVRLKDLWGFGVAQAASEIGPDEHEEFFLRYDLKILRECGLNAYGCCEPYTRKFDMLKRNVPRLRRVSVSPWCDVDRAVEELGDRYILSWKPNPALTVVGSFNEAEIRRQVRRTLDVARGCVLEIIHKDTSSVQNEPERLARWTRIVREEIERT